MSADLMALAEAVFWNWTFFHVGAGKYDAFIVHRSIKTPLTTREFRFRRRSAAYSVSARDLQE
ncbi:hypothetical protein BN1708_002583 [Verticillium longisporum]|uniref:Uncharacterized protein n=1 Tax=Verticillium longisporum TaxID=100787 RepID=A0A0G4KTZ6_VERLO|nr:hypothetical protein BN1708_002583 [Verticillium longisporum]